MTRILIVDDHPVFRRGLAFMLSTSGHVVVGEAASGSEAIDAVRELQPELVILDLGLPELHGSRVAARVRAEHPGIRIVVVTMYADDENVAQTLETGVDAYILKDAPPEQLLAAIDAATAGARVLGTGVALPRTVPSPDPLTRHGFTAREASVAALLVQGLGNRAIGSRLGISEKTAANYVAAVRLKVGAESRYDAARLLREE